LLIRIHYYLCLKKDGDKYDSSYEGNLLSLHGDVTNHLNHLANHGTGASQGVEVVSLRMDTGDRDRGDDAGVEKLFGGLMRGTVSCPGSERLATYAVDLRWPSSFVTTRSKNFVVTGKTGAFASDGKVT